ncbi:MAG: membrane dipeptidase [Chloroflexi bacterium]|nr:membrane dipeptidase [Chloroflexota bacterium]
MDDSREPEIYDFGLNAGQEERARRLHAESIVVDMLFQGPCGPAAFTEEMNQELRPDYQRDRNAYRAFSVARNLPDRLAARGQSEVFREWWETSGITAGSRQCGNGTFEQVLHGIANVTATFDGVEWLVKALKARDIRRAKAEGKRAGYLHSQNTLAIEQNLDRLNLFYDLGMRMVQLTYNSTNLAGGGCTDRGDAGLTSFGIRVVQRMNDLGMIVDTGHTGQQSTIDACKVSRTPVVASHTCALALSGHPRGKTDEALRAIAGTGGAVGVVTLPTFLGDKPQPTVEDFLDHVDYIVNLIGVEHVGIGTDWPLCMPHWLLVEIGQWANESEYPEWKRAWQESEWLRTLKGVRDYREFINITRGLVARGYSDGEIKAILGENFLRVFEEVCG